MKCRYTVIESVAVSIMGLRRSFFYKSSYKDTRGDLVAISKENGYLLVDGERIRFGDITDVALS